MAEVGVDQSQKHSSDGSVSSPRPAPSSGLVGRELDALVAERVMGFKVGCLKRDVKQENPFDDYTPYRNNRTGELMSGTMYSEGMAVIGCSSVPRYSTDIAAAMKVVERFRIDDPRTNIVMECGTRLWSCEIWTTMNPPRETAETLPLAICRAALAAVALNKPERDAESWPG